MGVESLKSKMLTKPHKFTAGIEGPSCDKKGNIYAVNFKKSGTIGKVTPNGNSSVFIELPKGSIGSGTRIDRNGTLFIADYVKHNIFAVNIETKEIRVFAHNPDMNQPNDLAITNQGVLFASDPNWSESTGQLWRIDKNGVTHLLETNMGTTNGIEVSPDDKKLYVNETEKRKIWVYDLSSNYELSNKRLLIEFTDFGLDGMRCDMAGNLFVTRIGKGVVAKVSPDGHLLSEIHFTGKKCNNLTFGGPDGKTCYVTVADTGNIQMFQTDVPGRCWSLLHDR
ncbi:MULTISPECIES: SMP-30/gluconolactonase/LRE family protein [unclassified Bacillus (in: firmicutes)]|uniref:SMP-30/gluconolactonase/LRE family protein n=1 Tax=unclassified Bacillus (in: firmicutes) TaxID=185979 RepID=UPI0008F22AC8|nr:MULTISPECIES: SMP-30/gluconolactonase/LRE family protein [unclassified Bacillus (in: firmicutes)]SFH99791.1 Sugar lactone lactonase YvrE [Bacillus sp. 71mf]SFS93180.1 Sugar lactone lactonase YvrE [Bacillus sp. 103mf]